MKQVLILTLVFLSLSAYSSDWSLKNESDTYDLMPLTPKTKFSSETLFNSTNSDDQVLTIGSANYFTRKHSNLSLNENFNYGAIESLEIGASIGYQISDEIKLNYGPASSTNGLSETYKQSGLKNPVLNARYRLLSQSSSFANGDFLLSFSPNIGTSKDSTATQKGNALRGSTLILAGFEVGKKFSDMAWRLGFKGNFYGTGKSEDVSNSTSTTTKDSYSDILFDGSWQWLFSSKYVLNLNAGFGSIGDSVGTSSAHIKVNEQKRSYTLFGVDFKYILTKDTDIGLIVSNKLYDKTNLVISNTQTNAVVTLPEASTSDTIVGLSIKTLF